jgi:hypothetical protein
MRKKKKRLQMQAKTLDHTIYQALAESVALGILEIVGYDANGEPLYQLSQNASARMDVLRKALPAEQVSRK